MNYLQYRHDYKISPNRQYIAEIDMDKDGDYIAIAHTENPDKALVFTAQIQPLRGYGHEITDRASFFQ